MASSPSALAPPAAPGRGVVPLPDRAPGALRALAARSTVLAWAEHDLDEARRFVEGWVLLTDAELVVARRGSEELRRLALSAIASARTREERGLGQLDLAVGDATVTLLHTRRHHPTMAVLVRRLRRRLAAADGEGRWLEAVDLASDDELRCARCGLVLLASAEGACPRCAAARPLLGRLLDLARPYRRRLWAAVGVTLLISALSTIPPYCSLHLIDDGIRARDLGALAVWGFLSAGALVAIEVTNALRTRIMAEVGIRFARDLRQSVFAHLQTLGLRYYQKRRTGSLLARVTTDTERIWQFVVLWHVNLLRDGAMILFVAVVMFAMSPPLALASLLPLPFLAAVTYWRSVRFQGLFHRAWYARSRMSAIAGDSIPGVRVVKAFGGEDRETVRFGSANDDVAARQLELDAKWATTQPLFSVVMRLGALFIWMLGGTWIVTSAAAEESLTLGVLTAFAAYLWQFYGPVIELAASHRVVAQTTASAQRILEVLDTVPEVTSKPSALRPPRLEGRVELEEVSFSYDGAQPALDRVSLAVEPGEMIGICGPSGAGKTTLVHLVCRFYDAREGRVLLDGRDVRDYDLAWLRRQIGVVLQEPFLFHGTILDNIRYGAPEATERQVIEAARAAEAHDFIVGLPDGYDTLVGERGLTLSGGERQRLSIARALVHDPRILVLDEATSSVDVETEARIRAALDRLVKGRTTFAIAHRLSTLRAAHRLVVLDKGALVELGTHEALLAREGGIYARMHATQAELGRIVAVAG